MPRVRQRENRDCCQQSWSVCGINIYIYMYLGEEKGGVLVSRMFTRTIESIRGAFMACSKFNSDMINIAALHPPTYADEHV